MRIRVIRDKGYSCEIARGNSTGMRCVASVLSVMSRPGAYRKRLEEFSSSFSVLGVTMASSDNKERRRFASEV